MTGTVPGPSQELGALSRFPTCARNVWTRNIVLWLIGTLAGSRIEVLSGWNSRCSARTGCPGSDLTWCFTRSASVLLFQNEFAILDFFFVHGDYEMPILVFWIRAEQIGRTKRITEILALTWVLWWWWSECFSWSSWGHQAVPGLRPEQDVAPVWQFRLSVLSGAILPPCGPSGSASKLMVLLVNPSSWIGRPEFSGRTRSRSALS